MTNRSEPMLAAEFAALAEMPSDDAVPPLDRAVVDESMLSPHQLEWRRTGVVVLRKFIPPSLIDEYRASREGRLPDHLGYPTSWAYMQIPEIRAIALYQPLAEIMTSLLGEPLAMHFDLTQWVSTERDWHQDDYLNPPEINSYYMAVWFACDTIDDDCGPFEYVPGSHHWPVVRGHLVRALMPEEDRDSPNWPKLSEPYVVDAYERQLKTSGLPVERFLAERATSSSGTAASSTGAHSPTSPASPDGRSSLTTPPCPGPTPGCTRSATATTACPGSTTGTWSRSTGRRRLLTSGTTTGPQPKTMSAKRLT